MPSTSSIFPKDGRRREQALLIVEDDEAVLALMATLMENEGYEVLRAGDGPTALELVKQRDERLDLVISDVGLPGLSGGRLVAQLAELRPDLTFLYVSGERAPPESLALEDATGNAIPFLPKPFSPSDLIRAVRAALERSRLRPRQPGP